MHLTNDFYITLIVVALVFLALSIPLLIFSFKSRHQTNNIIDHINLEKKRKAEDSKYDPNNSHLYEKIKELEGKLFSASRRQEYLREREQQLQRNYSFINSLQLKISETDVNGLMTFFLREIQPNENVIDMLVKEYGDIVYQSKVGNDEAYKILIETIIIPMFASSTRLGKSLM